MREKEIPGSFKISIELEAEKTLSGDDLFKLLDHIDMCGSISQAASRAGVSYRYSWGLIQKAEQALGLKLVEKHAGGSAGGGTVLTREGREMLMQYLAFRSEIDGHIKRYLPSTQGVSQKDKPAYPHRQLHHQETREHQLILASTMEPVETGLLDILEQAFYRHSGILVRHIAAGSGRALEIARGGRADMVLTHAPELEDQFMQEGWGALKVHIMSNPFVLVGPEADPAGIADTHQGGVVRAFQRIAEKKAFFVSRGDRSGTHLRELEIWEAAGLQPEGAWYMRSAGLVGNLGILRLAQEKQAYTLVDRASHIISRLTSRAFLQGNGAGEIVPELTNRFALTLVNPARVSSVRFEEALKFVQWLQGVEAREIIQTFGRENYNTPLFSTRI